jgi:hypothetical protein
LRLFSNITILQRVYNKICGPVSKLHIFYGHSEMALSPSLKTSHRSFIFDVPDEVSKGKIGNALFGLVGERYFAIMGKPHCMFWHAVFATTLTATLYAPACYVGHETVTVKLYAPAGYVRHDTVTATLYAPACYVGHDTVTATLYASACYVGRDTVTATLCAPVCYVGHDTVTTTL